MLEKKSKICVIVISVHESKLWDYQQENFNKKYYMTNTKWRLKWAEELPQNLDSERHENI